LTLRAEFRVEARRPDDLLAPTRALMPEPAPALARTGIPGLLPASPHPKPPRAH
jgi:hypothetical protein